MHDNFEREVQRKMEELNLTPSVPVWEKIELQIRPEKRRRRLLIWFFLGMLLLSGGIFSYQFFTANKEADNKITDQVSTNQRPVQSIPSTNKHHIPEEKKQPSITNISKESKVAQPLAKPEAIIEGKSERPLQSSGPARRNTVGTVKEKFAKDGAIATNKKSDRNVTTNEPMDTPVESQRTTDSPKESAQVLSNPSINLTVTDTAAIDNKITVVDSTKTASPEKVIMPPVDSSLRKKAAASSKWKRRILFAAGLSDQVASLSTTKAMMDVMVPQNSGIGTGGPVFDPKPADITSGFSFMAGYELSKKLSEHFELSVGLRYAYYSTQLSVGNSQRMDSVVRYGASNFTTNQFYTNVGRNNFTNRFHTLQVPITIHYKPAIRLPFYVSAGASYGQVISTNALTFSRTSNLYYRNKENDVRSLLPLHASLQVGLFEKAKTSMRIGPSIQYNLLKSQKEDPSNASHLFFAGLHSTINF